MYTKESFANLCGALFEQCPGNRVDIPGTGMIELFDRPLIGFAAADDALFMRYKKEEIIGPEFMSPEEWLPGAKTVAAFFFPFTEIVRGSNREDPDQPSAPWLYGRIEGQQFLNAFMGLLLRRLTESGIGACVPSLDERFKVQFEMVGEDFHADSRWSERHAAYACGLGTFGLSRGLITKRGMAGRVASIIIEEELAPDARPYTGVYDYCIHCGVCAAKCPAGAISMESGKNNRICHGYLNRMKEQYAPRYGCGKCQVGVPCEFKAPAGKRETEESFDYHSEASFHNAYTTK